MGPKRVLVSAAEYFQKSGSNASADNSIKVLTYLAPLGTRSSKRTLKIRERRQMSSNCSSLWIPAVVRHSARSQNQSPCQVRGYKSHWHFLEIRRDLSTLLALWHSPQSLVCVVGQFLSLGWEEELGFTRGIKQTRIFSHHKGKKPRCFFQGLIRLSVFLGFGIKCSWFKDSWNNMAIGIKYI